MLQGSVTLAVELLTKAANTSRGWLPDVEMKAVIYLMHCRRLQFLWTPQGCSLQAAELATRFDFQKEDPIMLARIAVLKEILNDSGISWTHDLLELQRVLVTARPGNPSPSCLSQSKHLSIPSVRATIESATTEALDVHTRAGFFIELAWLYRLVRSPEFHTRMESVRVWMEPGLGAAHYEMRLGDHNAISSGTPETWDMFLEQGVGTNAPAKDDELQHFNAYLSANTKTAKRHYQTAKAIYEELGINRGVAAVHLRLGYLATLPDAAGDFEKALGHAIKAKDLYESCGDAAGTQLAVAHSCLCRIGLGQLPEDIESATSIGIWGREHGSFSFAFGIGLLFAKLARRWLIAFGDYERSLAAHRLAEALFTGLNAKLSKIYGMTDQLDVYDMLGDRDSLIITAERAVEVCQELATQPDFVHSNQVLSRTVEALCRVFSCAQSDMDPDLMEHVVDRLNAVRESFSQSPDSAGTLEDVMGELMTMEGAFQEFMSEMSSADSAPSAAETSHNRLTEMLARARSVPLNLENFQRQATMLIIDNTTSTAAAEIPRYRARRAHRDGNQQEADRQWSLARTEIEERTGDLRELHLVTLYGDMKRTDEAAGHVRAYYNERIAAHNASPAAPSQDAKNLRDKQWWQWQNQVLDMFTRIGYFDEASQMIKRLEEQWGSDWWKREENTVWEKLSILAQVEEGHGRYEAACRLYAQAMDAFEHRRNQLSMDEYKTSLSSDSMVQEVYFSAARTAVKRHRLGGQGGSSGTPSPSSTDVGFKSLERGKSRSLLDLLAGGTQPVGQNTSERGQRWSTYKQLLALQATQRSLLAQAYNSKDPNQSRIVELKQQIEKQETHRRELEEELTQRGPPGQLGGSIADVIELQSLRDLLQNGTALLQYAYRNNDLIAWMINGQGIIYEHWAEVPEVELELHVRRFHRSCDELTDGDSEHAAWLAERLLLPFSPYLKMHSRLIFVPYGTLHMLPFHALPWEGQPLICTHSVSYLPSASTMSYLGHQCPKGEALTVLAVGNPSQKSGAHSGLRGDLPYSEVEANVISRIFTRGRALCSSRATKQAVEREIGQYSVLHFATHGVLAADVPMRSAVYLADDERITVDELMGRDLKADLVVLSACNTGRGRVTDGEEVIGFARALLAAGVRHVLVSLWPVDDKATCYFMENFYTRLREGDTPVDALRTAQLALRGTLKENLDAHLVKLTMTLGRENADHDDATIPRRGGPIPRRGGIEPASRRRPARDLSHPNFWAPFVLISAQ
ncbi:hypothetical protein AUP68_10581 [Ilyonectria robusta]